MYKTIEEKLSLEFGCIAYKGFDYLIRTLIMMNDDIKSGIKVKIFDYYTVLAKQEGVSMSACERTIRQYKEALQQNIDLSKILKTKIGKRYTNKEFVINVYMYLRREGVL